MSHSQHGAHGPLQLPLTVLSKSDVAHLIAEIEQYDRQQSTRSVREKVGETSHDDMPWSQAMIDFVEHNSLDLSHAHERSDTLQRLRRFKQNMAVIHLTFAAEVDHDSLKEIVGWIRESIDPLAVVSVGMQPSLIGGVHVRTPNHVHDLSVRGLLAGHRDVLVKELEAIGGRS